MGLLLFINAQVHSVLLFIDPVLLMAQVDFDSALFIVMCCFFFFTNFASLLKPFDLTFWECDALTWLPAAASHRLWLTTDWTAI